MDNDSNKIISDGLKMWRTIHSEGWGLIEQRIRDRINTLTDLRSIPNELKGDERSREIDVRLGAVTVMEQWLEEIWGEAQAQAENNEEVNKKQDDNSIITYHGNPEESEE